ncbi:GNAT family N-acetyltransferase [Thalassotalea sp. Y01]|uniref:GNAT family N-acetyltransferase n=1 Tax=Thalassotalea sp. Y01 TaxID=2729613 RepID=UPI00145FCA0C|nr:GNAT family N-acetyltransferase [Thalassotalea sp. Y01]NMP16321.1 GNAT family N-acetyltransferase [Thalassotalea sp. Y01]
MQVHLLKSDDELAAVADVLLQLRPQYTQASIIAQIQKQRLSGYQIAYVLANQQVLCVAGFVVGEKLAWGKHVYIDDLVTNEQQRSTGVGKFIIDWFKAYCIEHNCQQLHLDSGIQKFPAHRFYLRNRFNIASHHFSITDLAAK